MTIIELEVRTCGENESDTNADIYCLGTNFISLSYTNRIADVYPYDSSYEPMTNVPIVLGGTAYDNSDGNTYILVFHEALYYGKKLGHSLINPNQIRHNRLEFWDNPYDREHNICIEAADNIIILLRFEGTKLSFKTRVPSRKELSTCVHIDMTDTREWDPSYVKLGEVTSHLDRQRDENQTAEYQADELQLQSICPSLVEFKERCIQKIKVMISEVAAEYNEQIPARRTFIF